MCLIYRLFIAAFDLAGIVCSIQMLWNCFKDETKYKFLQKCRSLAIFQCACQVAILVTNAVQSWPGFGFESCDVLGGLLVAMNFLLACTMAAILIRRVSGFNVDAYGNQELAHSKLKQTAAASITCSIIVWYICLSQKFLSMRAVKGILLVVTITFVILLYDAVLRSNSQDQLTHASTNTLNSTRFSLWGVCQQNKITLFSIALSLIFLAVLLRALPRPSFSVHFELNIIFQELMYSLITRLVVGVALSLTICDLIDSSYEENERNIIAI